MKPWSDEPIKNGVRCKAIPFISSEGAVKLIETYWESLPMWAKDILTVKALDGHNPWLKEMLERIKREEGSNGE